MTPALLVASVLVAAEPAPSDDAYRLALNFDLFTLTSSTDGGRVNHFAQVDLMVMWPLFGHWNPYAGIGAGLLAPRARAGIDLMPWGRHESGPLAKLGARYIFTTWVSAPESFESFDAEAGLAHGFMGEAALGWRFRYRSLDLLLLGVYLVGPMYPSQSRVQKRAGVEPSGSSVFHGGTVSFALEW